MALDAAVKQSIIKEYATGEGDTGSPEVQVAVLTQRIKDLTEHMKEHKHDYHTQRGLLGMVGRRKRMLGYLKKTDINRYRALIERLGLRRLWDFRAARSRTARGRPAPPKKLNRRINRITHSRSSVVIPGNGFVD